MTEPTIKLKHILKATLEYIERNHITAESPEGQEMLKELELCGLALEPFKQSDQS